MKTEYNVYRTILVTEYLGTFSTEKEFHSAKREAEKVFRDELQSEELLCNKCQQKGVFTTEAPRIYLEQLGEYNEKNTRSNAKR